MMTANLRSIISAGGLSSQDGGTDFEIMFYDGTSVTRVTNNALNDDNPMLNNNGDIVWMQSVRAPPWRRSSANGATQAITAITTTPRNDAYPQINDAGDIVWYGYDGSHYQFIITNDRMDRLPR